MVNAFETVILKMRDLGMFQFLLPFMLTTTIFYGLLRKSKIFGEEFRAITVNAVVSLVAAFMVWAAPIILGVNIETSMASFFLQGTSATLIILVGLMMVSMFFPPDLAAELKGLNITGKYGSGILIVGIIVAVGVALTSGLAGLFLPAGWQIGTGSGELLSPDNVSSILMIVLLLGTVFILVWGGGGKK
ncbi:MAG: hypothetical protein NT016_02690 [Candidatus Aenigmarchaeota archaeon]|nr:hypothetical protein [Candidatus Aenigmarchaeota archaeon]